MGFALLAAGLPLCVAGAGLTVWLMRRVWKARKQARPAVTALTGLVLAAAAYGVFGVLVGVTKAMGAVGGQSIDPSSKARMLGEGIAEAMNCAALALLIWVPSFIAAFILTRRMQNRSAQTPGENR